MLSNDELIKSLNRAIHPVYEDPSDRYEDHSIAYIDDIIEAWDMSGGDIEFTRKNIRDDIDIGRFTAVQFVTRVKEYTQSGMSLKVLAMIFGCQVSDLE